MSELHDFDILREGRRWSREEIERKYLAPEHPGAPGKMELVHGKLFHSEAQRVTMLGWMLEMVGADAAVRLGDPEVWREAVENLPPRTGGSRAARMEKLEALAEEVRRVVENAGWRERNLYWPEGMHRVEEKLRELDWDE